MINDIIYQGLFYIFAAIAVVSAINVVFAKNPVKAVLSLVVTFFGVAAIWLLLESEFLAITLFLVYIGAVLVLFLFVIMMLDIEIASLRSGFARFLPLGLFVALLMVLGIVYALSPRQFIPDTLPIPTLKSAHYSNITELGMTLYTDYLYPFILAGVILLVAIVAAISLTYRGRRGSKAPLVENQLKVTKASRLTIVKMP